MSDSLLLHCTSAHRTWITSSVFNLLGELDKLGFRTHTLTNELKDLCSSKTV